MAKILLVEDNEMNRDMLSRRLLRRGFELVMAEDGEAGVALAQSEQPDLILMDMSLPILDGWEATKQIKALPLTASIPVIALTAHAMVGDREKTLAAGCDDYDTKPVDLKRLLSKINTLLEAAAAKRSSDEISNEQSITEPSLQTQEKKALSILEDEPPIEPVLPQSPKVSELEPTSAQHSPETAPQPKPRFNSDSIPILVVDDNMMNREVLGRRLKKADYHILFAETGEEALQTLQNEAVALILLDVMMPGIGGWETLKRIRSQYKAAELPVIMVTAKDQSEDVVNAFSLGANDYITKPIDFPITLARIQNQLQLLELSSSPTHTANNPPPPSPSTPTAAQSIKSDSTPPSSANPSQRSQSEDSKVLVTTLSAEAAKVNRGKDTAELLNHRYKIFQTLQSSQYHQNLLAYDMERDQKIVTIQHFTGPKQVHEAPLKTLFQHELTYLAPVINRNASQISRILDTYIQEDNLYIVQQYIEGNLLSQELESGQAHSSLYSLNVLGRLLEILSVLHQNNIVLQYFSPQSFTRRKRDGEICLTDLGVSQRIHSYHQQSTEIFLLDNIESLRKSQQYLDFSDDLYLVGRMAIQALTGIYPDEYQGEYIHKRLEWDKSGDIDFRCRNFINRLIHPIKELRFQSATEAYKTFIQSQLLFHVLKAQKETAV